MKKFFIITGSVILGIIIGAVSAFLIFDKQTSKTSNFTVKITNAETKPEKISYSSNNLPPINLSQDSAVQKFKSLYTHAVIKSITLSLNKNTYVYDITGYDNRKDCSIQIDATNKQRMQSYFNDKR